MSGTQMVRVVVIDQLCVILMGIQGFSSLSNDSCAPDYSHYLPADKYHDPRTPVGWNVFGEAVGPIEQNEYPFIVPDIGAGAVQPRSAAQLVASEMEEIPMTPQSTIEPLFGIWAHGSVEQENGAWNHSASVQGSSRTVESSVTPFA